MFRNGSRWQKFRVSLHCIGPHAQRFQSSSTSAWKICRHGPNFKQEEQKICIIWSKVALTKSEQKPNIIFGLVL